MRIRAALPFSALIAVGINDSSLASLRLFGPAQDSGGIVITTEGNVDFVVTDPLGRRIGIDPATGAEVAEIPDASYSVDFLADDDPSGVDHTTPEITIFETVFPVEGFYQIDVHAAPGTEYTLTIFTYDLDGNLSSMPVETRSVGSEGIVTHRLNYSLDLRLGASIHPSHPTPLPPHGRLFA